MNTAKKPDDWDDEEDGEWEAPIVTNPKVRFLPFRLSLYPFYIFVFCQCSVGCGEWKRPRIRNPAYKGKWYAPKIKNPAYKGPWSARKVVVT